MKYKPLPFVQRLQQATPADADKARAVAADQLFRSDGFQILAHMLRTLETAAHSALGVTTDVAQAQRLLGRIHTITEIKSSLTALLPAGEPTPDFFDEASEEYLGAIEEETAGA